jgi:hypothetical protein
LEERLIERQADEPAQQQVWRSCSTKRRSQGIA